MDYFDEKKIKVNEIHELLTILFFQKNIQINRITDISHKCA